MEINSANFKEMASGFGMKMLEAFRDAFDGLVSQECEDVFLADCGAWHREHDARSR